MMAAQEHQQEEEKTQHHENQEQKPHDDNNEHHYHKLLSSYLGISFSIFLGFLPKNSTTLLSNLQTKNQTLTFKLMQADEQLNQLLSRRKEESKANARVVEIFASHRHSWQQEEKRLLQQIDECNEEIAYLRGKVEEFEGVEADLKANVEDLKREISERDEMLNFMSRSKFELMEGTGGGGECYSDIGVRYGKSVVSEEKCCNDDEMGSVYGQGNNNNNGGFGSDFLSSVGAPKFWSEKANLWQDMHYESMESHYHMKHFVSRRESPWKADGDSTGVSSKLKLLEQELLNLERVGKADPPKVPSQMQKQAKRYQALAAKIDDLCRRMEASDPCERTLSSEFRTQRQTEFLLEAFRLQQRASETNQKLTALQTETGKSYQGGDLDGPAQLATRRSLDSIRNNFKEIQRNLEIWLARIIGDLEGLLARDGASRVREYYVSRYPFVQ